MISTEDRAEDLVQRYRSKESSGYSLTGMCLLDADRTGEKVSGIPVTSSAVNVLQYLCREWVDEVVLSVPGDYPGTDD